MTFRSVACASIALATFACGGGSSEGDSADIGALEQTPPAATAIEKPAVITAADGLEIRALLVDGQDRNGRTKDAVLRVTRGTETISFDCANPHSRVYKSEPVFFDLACYHTLPSREHAAVHLHLEQGKLTTQVDVSHGASDPKVAAAYKLVAGSKAKDDLGYVGIDATLASNPDEPNYNPFALLAHVTAPVEEVMKSWPSDLPAEQQPNSVEITIYSAMYMSAPPLGYEPFNIAVTERDAWSGVASKDAIKESLLKAIRP